MDGLISIFKKLPIGGASDDKAQQAEDIKNKAYDFNPDIVAPKEVQEQLFAVLKWRDGVYRDIMKKIQMIPGLENLIDQLTNALNACMFLVFKFAWLAINSLILFFDRCLYGSGAVANSVLSFLLNDVVISSTFLAIAGSQTSHWCSRGRKQGSY